MVQGGRPEARPPLPDPRRGHLPMPYQCRVRVDIAATRCRRLAWPRPNATRSSIHTVSVAPDRRSRDAIVCQRESHSLARGRPPLYLGHCLERRASSHGRAGPRALRPLADRAVRATSAHVRPSAVFWHHTLLRQPALGIAYPVTVANRSRCQNHPLGRDSGPRETERRSAAMLSPCCLPSLSCLVGILLCECPIKMHCLALAHPKLLCRVRGVCKSG